jgi:hypothetical protein
MVLLIDQSSDPCHNAEVVNEEQPNGVSPQRAKLFERYHSAPPESSRAT